MTEPNDRAKLIRKILTKAEDPACTPAEREALNAKASELIIKWGIDDAMLTAANADRLQTESIITVILENDAPKSYAHEMAIVGYHVAEVLGCRAIIWSQRGKGTAVKVVGFESVVTRVTEQGGL